MTCKSKINHNCSKRTVRSSVRLSTKSLSDIPERIENFNFYVANFEPFQVYKVMKDYKANINTYKVLKKIKEIKITEQDAIQILKVQDLI